MRPPAGKPVPPAGAPGNPSQQRPVSSWTAKDCTGAFEAHSQVKISGGTATLVGTAVNRTEFDLHVGDSGPGVHALDSDGQSVRLWAKYTGHPDSRAGVVRPGETWAYTSDARPMRSPDRNWQDLDWTPVVQFAAHEVQQFCQQRSVPAHHVIG